MARTRQGSLWYFHVADYMAMLTYYRSTFSCIIAYGCRLCQLTLMISFSSNSMHLMWADLQLKVIVCGSVNQPQVMHLCIMTHWHVSVGHHCAAAIVNLVCYSLHWYWSSLSKISYQCTLGTPPPLPTSLPQVICVCMVEHSSSFINLLLSPSAHSRFWTFGSAFWTLFTLIQRLGLDSSHGSGFSACVCVTSVCGEYIKRFLFYWLCVFFLLSASLLSEL